MPIENYVVFSYRKWSNLMSALNAIIYDVYFLRIKGYPLRPYQWVVRLISSLYFRNGIENLIVTSSPVFMVPINAVGGAIS